ncbi:MAG: cadmium-translocating P-type ATPase [Armatimonadetes bacterium]|nr:cadmium-translocating P-type ATPase [Armatimonadota bacterium]
MAERVRLKITGMTCAACARRIEKVVSKVDGVLESQVNFATEKGEFQVDPSVSVERLIEAIRKAGFDAHKADATAPHREIYTAARLWLAVVFSLPVVAISMFMHDKTHELGWLLFALTLPVQFGAGLPFYRSAWSATLAKAPNMETLIVLGSTAAFVYSVAVLLMSNHGNLYFEASAVIITLILLGKRIEETAKRRAREALASVWTLLPRRIMVERNGEYVESELGEARIGDKLLVRAGDRVPVDGEVVSGAAWIEESALTGEPVPVSKGEGERAIAGSIVTDGAIELIATAVGEDTLIQQVANAVETAQASKAALQRLADRISAVFVPAIIVLALVSVAVWFLITKDAAKSILTGVSVLVIACPCALGLAAPIAILTGTARASRSGIVVKGIEALERVRRLDAVVLDKTGTLTAGNPVVVDTALFGGDLEANLAYASALEKMADHPLARAIVAYAPGVVKSVENVRIVPGGGAMGEIDGVGVAIGSPRFLSQIGIELNGAADYPVVLAVDGKASLGFVFADEPTPEGAEAIRRLQEAGIELYICSGDRREAVMRMAEAVGVSPENVLAEMLPDQKAELVRTLQAQGKKVAFVGDGINDAPALASADLGIAVGAGTGLAAESADLILLNNDLRSLPIALRVSRAMAATIRSNLGLAFLYNAIAIPIALAGRLDPMIAAGAMSLSSLSVVFNALRLLYLR